jgi:hypothetical protein
MNTNVTIEPPSGSAFLIILDRLGRGAVDVAVEVLEALSFLGQTAVALIRLLVQPG